MMNNLFSSFDPSTSMLNLNWIIIFLALFSPNPSYFKNKMNKIFNLIMNNLTSEIFSNSNKTLNKSTKTLMLSLFLFLFLLNFLSMFPFVFSSTAQMVINFPIAFMLWMTIISISTTNNLTHTITHLLPVGTPNLLMPIMVLIELISLAIRPITLSVRLTANMIAGHLLLTLLTNFTISMSKWNTMMVFMLPMILSTLEMAVAFIQSYVFMTLITLYSAE